MPRRLRPFSDSAHRSYGDRSPYPTALPTATLEVAPAPTPTNIPTGWSVLAGLHLSLAYPREWAVRTIPPHEDLTYTLYSLAPPTCLPTARPARRRGKPRWRVCRWPLR